MTTSTSSVRAVNRSSTTMLLPHYCARDWYEADPNPHCAIDFLTNEEMLKYGDEEHLKRLHMN